MGGRVTTIGKRFRPSSLGVGPSYRRETFYGKVGRRVKSASLDRDFLLEGSDTPRTREEGGPGGAL